MKRFENLFLYCQNAWLLNRTCLISVVVHENGPITFVLNQKKILNVFLPLLKDFA